MATAVLYLIYQILHSMSIITIFLTTSPDLDSTLLLKDSKTLQVNRYTNKILSPHIIFHFELKHF